MTEPQDPYRGQPGYPHGPQAYEPQPYDPRAYPQQAYGPPAYGPPPFTPPPTSSSGRRSGIIAAVVVIVLVVAGVGTWLAVRSSSNAGSDKKYGVPASFDGYSQLHNSTADRVNSSIRSLGTTSGGAAKRIFDASTIGVYSHNTGDQPVLIALIVPTSASGSQGGDDVAREILAGAVPTSTTFPSGSHGGSTRCGTAVFGTAQETMCAWSDAQASGMLVSVREAMTAEGLAALTQSFRDAAE